MFMVKDEFENIKNLVRVKVKVNRKNFMWFFAIAAFMHLTSIAATIFSVLNDAGVRHYTRQDFSVSFFFGLVIALIVMMFLYRQTNNYLSVFPQTNNSRFISSQIISYIIVIFVGLTALMLHLVSYCVISLMSLSVENVHLALGFDFGFIVVGFLSFLAYGFLIVAVIDLVGVILRKWTIFGVAAILAIASLVFATNTATVREIVPRALAFLVKEQSFGLFFAKAMVIWIVVAAVSLVINKRTVYYKSGNAISGNKIVIACVAAVSVVIIGLWLFTFNTASPDGGGSVNVSAANEVDDFLSEFYSQAHEIRIDVSHLPRGSDIHLTGENIEIIAGGAAAITGSRNAVANISGTSALESIQGDTVIIRFRPPYYYVNGVDMTKYANPHINAYLTGDTIHLEYSVRDAAVVILPIWGFARQFDGYRDKGLVTGNLLGFSSGGGMNAHGYIDVE